MSCFESDASQFQRAMTRSLADGVADRLVESATARERAMLDAFVAGQRRTTAPVVVVSQRMMIVDEVAGAWGLQHDAVWGGLEGFSQSLAQEVRPFGIHVTLIEPGGFTTDWAGASAELSEPIHAYDEVRADVQRSRATEVKGNPAASASALLRVVDAEQPPLRCFFGASPLEIVEADYASRLETWRAWQPVADLAQG